MLGFSITKILFTVGIVIAVWRGFKMFENFQKRSEAAANEPPAKPRKKAAKRDEVEMIECPRCGTFLPKGQYCTCNASS